MNIIINDICRCCMSDTNSSEMRSIFSEIQVLENKTLLSDMLMACTTVNISKEDNLPLRLCASCVNQLTVSYQFKTQCEKTEDTLRNIVYNDNIQLFVTKNDDELQHEEIKQLSPFTKVETLDEISDIKNETETNSSDRCEEILKDYNYICDICNESFSTDNNLRKHISEVHPNFTCTYCERTFSNKILLRAHLRIHTIVHICTLCNKTFKSSHGLWYHVKRHYNIKEFQCPLCDKKFIVKQALNKHFETLHTDDKKHLCSECGKAYSTHDALSYHLKQHKGQRPYLCIHCGKTFKQGCHLKTHMWIHNGIKPFKCEICENCYTTGHQLKRHQVVHNRK